MLTGVKLGQGVGDCADAVLTGVNPNDEDRTAGLLLGFDIGDQGISTVDGGATTASSIGKGPAAVLPDGDFVCFRSLTLPH